MPGTNKANCLESAKMAVGMRMFLAALMEGIR